MIISIISTVNGMENEGMRNIATHISTELETMCTVRRSALGNPAKCITNTVGADAVIIFARASAKCAMLAKVLRLICKNVCFVLVQKPEPAFLDKLEKSVGRFRYFAIHPDDGAELRLRRVNVNSLSVGISTEKFHPAENKAETAALRQKYGISNEKPLVLHVGHLSAGRGLEEFLNLPGDRFERLVVASGMFTSAQTEEKLRCDGVTVVKEYLPDVSEVYRMADVYLFPTRSNEFVISVPLSVMEALACGTPVVYFDGVEGIGMIEAADGALTAINDGCELESAVITAAERFSENYESLLANPTSWSEAASGLYCCISENVKQSTER